MKPTLPRKRGRHPRPRPMATALVQVHALRVVAVRTGPVAHGSLRLRSLNIVRELGTAKSHPNSLGNWNQVYCAYPQRSGHRGRRRSCAISPQRCCIILATASSTPRLKFSSESPTSHRVLKVGPQTTYWLDRSTHRLDRRTKQQLHRAPPVVRE